MRLITLICCLTCLVGTAQDKKVKTGTIKGLVIDGRSELPLQAAKVAVVKDATQIVSVLTDERGEFKLEDIPEGYYTVTVDMPGYMPTSEGAVEVHRRFAAVLEFGLRSAEEAQQADLPPPPKDFERTALHLEKAGGKLGGMVALSMMASAGAVMAASADDGAATVGVGVAIGATIGGLIVGLSAGNSLKQAGRSLRGVRTP